MENEEVVVETEKPQEIETPQTEVQPEKDYKQMFEDQRRRAEKAEKEAKELQVWWEQRDKHIEQLEEYMLDEKEKTDL